MLQDNNRPQTSYYIIYTSVIQTDKETKNTTLAKVTCTRELTFIFTLWLINADLGPKIFSPSADRIARKSRLQSS